MMRMAIQKKRGEAGKEEGKGQEQKDETGKSFTGPSVKNWISLLKEF